MALQEHPDIRGSVLEIPGLNFFNILLASIVLAFLANVQKKLTGWNTPVHIKAGFMIYLLVIFISILRLLLDPGDFMVWKNGGYLSLWIEYCFNPIKWIIIGMLFYCGCNTRRGVIIALGALSALYILLALQVIRYVPLSGMIDQGEALSHFGGKMIRNEIGYSRVSMAMMLSGAFWAIISTNGLSQKTIFRLGVFALAGIVLLGMALTGGRVGYITWGVVGLILCTLRWRRILPLIPVAVMVIILLFPSVKERMLMGFADRSETIVTHNSENSEEIITSGRNLVWPHVIAKIGESKTIGHGREAMVRKGLHSFVSEKVLGEEDFSHPHSAYLEILLDAGVTGLIGVMIFCTIILWHSFRLFFDLQDPLFGAVGGYALSLVLSFLIAGFGSHHFYPETNMVGMFAAIGIMFRVSLERQHSVRENHALFEQT